MLQSLKAKSCLGLGPVSTEHNISGYEWTSVYAYRTTALWSGELRHCCSQILAVYKGRGLRQALLVWVTSS